MRFVPLTAELLGWAFLDDPDPVVHWVAGQDALLARLTAPPAFGEALLDNGQVMAAAGLVPHWRGRVEVWSTVNRDATARHRALAWRRCQAALAHAFACGEVRRAEMYVKASEPWRDRFAQLMGFQFEGLMRQWDPAGLDYCLYSRLADDETGHTGGTTGAEKRTTRAAR